MNEGYWKLPRGWSWSTVGEVGSLIQSGFAYGKKGTTSGDLLHLRPYNVGLGGEIDLSRQFHVPKAVLKDGDACLEAGDVLFNNTNSVELVGKAAIVRKPLTAGFSNHITLVRTRKDRCEGTWLALVLRELWQEGFFAQRCNKWIGQAGYNTTALKDTPIPLPATIEEQRRIVAKIEALFDRIREAKRLRMETVAKPGELLAAARQEVFTRATANSWEVRELHEVAPVNMGQSPPGKSYNSTGEGVPLLNGPTEFGDPYPITVQWTSAPTKVCRKGDILVCVRGATTGRMNWADREYCIGRGLAALTPDREFCVAEYVYHFVETQTQAMFRLAAGSTFPNLPGTKLKTLKIPRPPLQEQRRIVAYLDGVAETARGLKQRQEDTDAELKRLEQSILDRAFRAEL